MALITAQAKLHNAFKCRVVDKNISAVLATAATIGHRDPDNIGQFLSDVKPSLIKRIRQQVFRTNCTMSVEGDFISLSGSAALAVSSRLTFTMPTHVEIRWDQLEIPEGRNVTIQLEQGFVVEDLNQFPFALGLPLTANNNLISFRTPKRLPPMPLSSTANSTATVLRIQSSNVSLVANSNISTLPIYNPGRLAALFGGNFITTTNPVITTALGLHVTANSTLDIGNFRLLLGSSTFETSTFTMPDIPDGRVRLSQINLQTASSMSINAIKTTEIVLDSQNFALLNIQPVKTTSNNAELISTASIVTNANYFVVSFINNLNLQTAAELLNPKIDGYPWDFQKNMVVVTGWDYNPGDRNNFIWRIQTTSNTDFNLFTSIIVNVTTEQNISINGRFAGSTTDKFLTAQGNRNTPAALFFNIRNYSGQVIGTIPNTNLRVNYGGVSGGGAVIGSNFAYITYTQPRSGQPSTNNIEIVNLLNDTRSVFLSDVNNNTIQATADSNNFVAFKQRIINTETAVLTLRNKATNSNTRSFTIPKLQGGDFAEIIAISNVYFAVNNPAINASVGTPPLLTVYRIDNGVQVYQQPGLVDINNIRFYLDDNYIYRFNSGNLEVINLITGIKVQTINNIDAFVDSLGSRILLGQGPSNSGTLLVFEDSTD